MSPIAQHVAVRPAPAPASASASASALEGTGPAELNPATQGALALAPEVSANAAPAPPPLRLGRREEHSTATDDRIPDVQAWAARLVQALAEVIAGDRPIGQLVRWTDGTVYADINRRVRVLGLTSTAGSRGS